MDRRVFLWGLSNGATMLALSGAFWLGIGVGMIARQVHWAVPAVGTVVQVGGAFGLIRAAIRLRRRSGFKRSQLRQLEGFTQGQQRRIVNGMRWTMIIQTVVISVAVWILVQARAEHLFWPSIGVVISLHFAPLGWLFHVRPYYVLAIAGTIISVAAFGVAGTPRGIAALGLALAAVMWGVASYVLAHADRIADRGCAEPWAA
jgi:hypothetical protein